MCTFVLYVFVCVGYADWMCSGWHVFSFIEHIIPYNSQMGGLIVVNNENVATAGNNISWDRIIKHIIKSRSEYRECSVERKIKTTIHRFTPMPTTFSIVRRNQKWNYVCDVYLCMCIYLLFKHRYCGRYSQTVYIVYRMATFVQMDNNMISTFRAHAFSLFSFFSSVRLSVGFYVSVCPNIW